MGAKSIFKRHKNPVYLTCCIVTSLFFFGCQPFALFRPGSVSIDINGKKHLAATRELVSNKDFKAAAAENQRALEYYSQIPDMNHLVLYSYVQNAEILSELLARIMDDENRKLTLSTIIESNEEQINILTLSVESLKKNADALEKKLANLGRMSGKIKTLEKEKKMLQKQIDRLKEIDLNPGPVGSKQLAENFIPLINNN